MSVLQLAPPTHGPAALDLAVPQLSLLYDGLLTDTMTSICARTGSMATDVRLDYLEYAPHASLVLQVSADVDGRRRSVVLRTGAAVNSQVRETGVCVPELNGVAHWLPSDPSLPLMRATSRELHGLLPSSAAPTSPGDRAEGPARVLAYVPSRRATLSLEPYVLKSYATSQAFERARAAMDLLSDGRDLPTPRQVAALPEHRTTVQRHVEGTPASLSQAVTLAEHAGRLARRLHDSERRSTVRRDPAAQLRDARTAVEVLAAVLPDQAGRARALLRRLAAAAPTGLRLVLSHGDFTIDQLLLTDEGLVVTDVDNACQAPAALDIASFAANLVSGRTGDDERAYAVLSGLMAGHGAPPALAWHFAVALLRRCDRPFRRWKKRWPEKACNILAMAEEVGAWCD